MPKKKTNADLIDNFIEKHKKEKKVSEGTITTYKNIGKTLPFNLMSSQPTIIKKLKEIYDNPNTLQLYLNMIILVRRDNGEETDKLIKLRNSLREEIQKNRKENLSKLDDKLPSVDHINNELEKLKGQKYIINYLMINHALRNKDINLKMVQTLPEDKNENYILLKSKNKVILLITDYKTENKHGDKEIIINNSRFIKELKSLDLKDGDYLIPMKNGDKIKNITTFNDKILRMTIDNLGQNKLVKIVIKDLLNNKSFDKLEDLSKHRGTSMGVLLKSYNLHNGDEEEK
jgi:seryl-tRNA synthetase